MSHITVLCLLLLIPLVYLATKEQWRTRTIYQLMTDRFARSDDSKEDCKDLFKYCGGTWKGITKNLDYIKGMGFDAIWISPIIKNIEPGYHGYWASDLFKVNEHFGTEEDLVELVEECHKKNIYVMVDVVANHAGPIKFAFEQISPFNKAEHYHDYCNINSDDFRNNQWRVENCRLADLPDFKQENPYVKETLLKWITYIMEKYKFDGMRIDTVPEVPKPFWVEWNAAVKSFTMGEIFDDRIDYVNGYIGPLETALNYPIFFRIRYTWQGMNSFWGLVEVLQQEEQAFGDKLDYICNFINNHDNERFLHVNFNLDRFKGAIAFTMLFRGIPIFYYGDEQAFKGANDPWCREALWPHMDTNHEVYQFVKKVITFRKMHTIWNNPFKMLAYDDHFYAFARGEVMAVFSNADNYEQDKTINVPYPDGTRLCNYLKENECVTVSRNSVTVHVGISETKLFERRA